MIEGSCHCGAVTYQYRRQAKRTTSCNCSVCRRLAVLWIYAPLAEVTVTGKTVGYMRGEKSLAFHHCPTCGVTTHWEPVDRLDPEAYMAVNLRLADPDVVAKVPVRHFDGADTWEFLD